MSYSFNFPCAPYSSDEQCTKKDTCTDRHVIQGAINAIHNMPYGVGHLGGGSINLVCCNKTVKPASPAPTAEYPEETQP